MSYATRPHMSAVIEAMEAHPTSQGGAIPGDGGATPAGEHEGPGATEDHPPRVEIPDELPPGHELE